MVAVRRLLLVVSFSLCCFGAGGQELVKSVKLRPHDPSLLLDAVVREIHRRMSIPLRSGSKLSVIQYQFDQPDDLPEVLVYSSEDGGCVGGRCPLRLFTIVGDSYRDLLAAGGSPMVDASSDIAVDSEVRGGRYALDVNGTHFVWNGLDYVDSSKISRSELQTADFMDACRKNREIVEGGDVPPGEIDARRQDVCRCMADGFQTRGLSQPTLDSAVNQLIHGTSQKEWEQKYTAQDRWVFNHLWELQNHCLSERGLSAEAVWTGAFDPDLIASLDGRRFLEACSAQPWVVENRKIGTSDRAFAFCDCLTTALLGVDEQMTQADIDALTSFYSGQLQESEIDGVRRVAIGDADEASSTCAGLMPPRALVRP